MRCRNSAVNRGTSPSRLRAANEASDKIKVHTFEVYKMTHGLMSAVAKAEKLPAAEQDVLAPILVEEIDSEARWSQSFSRSEHVLEALAVEALAELNAGKTEPLDDLL